MKNYYVYCVENKINGQLYIGKSSNPRYRWSVHKTIAKGGPQIYKDRYHYFHKGLSKYGSENFILFILEAFSNEEEATQSEIYWIAYLKSQNIKLYNITKGGDGVSGLKHTEKSKNLMRQNHVYKSGSEHHMFGKTHTIEARNKISKAHTGKYVGNNNPMFGKFGILAPAFGRKGDKHPNTKISNIDLIILKQEIDSGKFTLTELSKKYNVSVATISNIKNKKART